MHFFDVNCEHNDLFPPTAKLGQTTRRGKDSFEMGVDGEPWRFQQPEGGGLEELVVFKKRRTRDEARSNVNVDPLKHRVNSCEIEYLR